MQTHSTTTTTTNTFTSLPTEVWVQALHMLDVRDLARLRCAGGGGGQTIPTTDSVHFVWCAGRVLSDAELAWFARARVRVALFEEVRRVPGLFFKEVVEYRRNGKLHRDNDLPALLCDDTKTQGWYQDGELHRDNDRPALIMRHSQDYFWHGKRHRPSGGPAIEYYDGRRFWYWHGKEVGNSLTPDEEPQWYTPSGRRSKKGPPKWAKWGAALLSVVAADNNKNSGGLLLCVVR